MKHTARNKKLDTHIKTSNVNPSRKHFGMFQVSGFRFQSARGITLLLVVLVLSALLSISLGIFNIVYNEFRISGEIADSFTALYAADQGVEHALFLDRGPSGPLCSGSPGVNCYIESQTLPNNSCYILRVDKTVLNASSTQVSMRATGEYPCGAGILSVKRALRTEYVGRR